MTQFLDEAAARELEFTQDALEAQQRRAGLTGKTVADSATHCGACEGRIPKARRVAIPGVQTCVDCQNELERVANANARRSRNS